VQLEKKGSEVFDHFMRAFVLEVSFIRSMQFDVGGILQRVKEQQEEHRKVALDALRSRMKKENSQVAAFLKDAYKKVSTSFLLDISEKYINERVRGKWSRVCQYYNEAI
jgi:fumarylacetoacetate (FAA) hydrolase family protein